MKISKRCLSLLLILAMLMGILPQHLFATAKAAESEAKCTYKVEIVSFIRGLVDDLRCSELLEARIYKSTDNGATWQVATDVEGTPVSELSYTWTNDSSNTPMVVFLSHDMTRVGIWGDTAEQTFQNGKSSTAVGGQWAALKTPDGSSNGGWGSNWGNNWGGWYPGGSNNNSNDEETTKFSGSITVQVKLPNGEVVEDTYENFGDPDLDADLNNIALGMFIGESKSLLNLLGESALVHITCSACKVTVKTLTDPDGSVNVSNSTITGVKKGQATLAMTVDKKGCTVHNGQTADVETDIFIFQKPETSTTTTTLTLKAGTLDERCSYYINGTEGIEQEDGSILFTGLTPDTDYTVDVVASYTLEDGEKTVTRYAYAYVDDTTKPVYAATVHTYLDGTKVDIADIHGEDVILYIKEENSTELIYLPHTGTGTYSINVDNGVYHVYHKEAGGFHQINENALVVANKAGIVDVHHYSVTYDPAGGAFTGSEAPIAENFASGKKVTAINTVPTRAGYVFVGWAYGDKIIAPGATVTESITGTVRLIAQWEREVNVSINITIDHTYIDANGNRVADNSDGKDDLFISLVGRDDANAPYLEIPNCDLVISESSHSGHTLLVNGVAVDNYAAAGITNINQTKYEDGETPTFTGLSAGKEYYVTVAKSNYSGTVTATKLANGDWVIDIQLKFSPESEEITFEVKMDEDVPQELYPEAVIVKILYYNEITGKWEIIAQHANGNPGVRVPITGQTGNFGSFPVWNRESGTETPYYYRMMVSAFVYKDGTIVPAEEAQAYIKYTDKNFTATVGGVSGGKDIGGLNGSYFDDGTQIGTLDATITLEAYNVTFEAEGGKINGGNSAVAENQYYIPDFDQYVPTMDGHKFLGWWYKDANGNYIAKATDGLLLTEDITLYAMWDQVVTGQVVVSGTYEKDGKTMTVWEADRATQAMVILQQITSDTVNNLKILNVPITWNGDLGTSGEYRFEGLDPTKSYRIEVIVTNYETVYQNSTTPAGTYDEDDYRVVYTEAKPWETFVNGKLSFEPESYKQKVEVDASQIGTDFRPGSVMTEIWYTERGSGDAYQVITQHVGGGLNVLIGADGKQNGEYAEEIWVEKWNGNLYDYQAHVSDEDVLRLPISVQYGPHANFNTASGQASNVLSVTLVPNRYNIIFDLNTEANDDVQTYVGAHVWSHDTIIDYIPVREGYVFKGWTTEATGVYEANGVEGKILASTHEEVILVAQWEKATISYKVEYYYDGQLEQTDTINALFGDEIDPSFSQKKVYNGKNYALDYVEGTPLTIGVNAEANVIKVYYGSDNLSDESDSVNTPDGIPDYYQVTVTFNVVNGTWVETGNNASIVRVYTLYTQNPNRPWTKLEGEAAPELVKPAGIPNTGFENSGVWTPTVPDRVEGNATYTLAYTDQTKYNVTVIVVNGTATQAGQNESVSSYVYSVIYNSDLTLNFAPAAGYALDYIEVDGEINSANDIGMAGWNSQTFKNVTENHIIRVVYAVDTVGGGNDGDQPDNIPDKYQKKVTFQVVNGTWDGTNGADKVCYVTLMTNGKWDENGTAQLPNVPTGMKPDAGFKKGTWNVTGFPETVSGTEPLIYTHTFKAIVYQDVVYTVEHYKQQSNGIFVLAEREQLTIPRVELNADENDFQNQLAAVIATAKDYGIHYHLDTAHEGYIAQGTPVFGQTLTLKLYYGLDSHTVKYDLNGGSAEDNDYSDATYLCGSTVSAKEAVHKHGYVFKGWKAQDGTIYQVNEMITVDQDIVLTAQWAKQTGLSYTVYFLEENTNKVLKQELVVGNMTYGDVVDSLSHVADIKDYKFMQATPETLTIDVDTAKNVITLYYTLDTVGGGDDGDQPDNIPDKHQKKVTFKVVSGKWNDNTATDKVVYVTLMTDGKWDVNGTAALTAPEVGEKPDAGFKAGAWDVTPPQTVSGTEEVVYTFTFEGIDTHPATGDNTNLTLWSILLMISGFGLMMLVILEQKKRYY